MANYRHKNNIKSIREKMKKSKKPANIHKQAQSVKTANAPTESPSSRNTSG
jgi:hypothetical protein